MTIRCITFDLDDTLWETGPVIARAERIAHEWMEDNAPEVVAGRSQDELTEHRKRYYATRPELSHDFTALRRAWLDHLFAENGFDEAMSERAFMAFWHERNAVKPFPQALAAIERLGERYILGTITNGNASVERIGLDHHFAFTVTAGDAGTMKPDPEIFRFALDKVGVKPEEAIHIGDDPHTDVHGAIVSGMRAVWVNPHQHSWNEALGRGPHAEVAAVAELEAVLERFG